MFTLVGNPANRRIQMFLAALGEPARVIAWRGLVEPGAPARPLGDGIGIPRIDAAGEDSEVERALIRRGEGIPHGGEKVSADELARIPDELGRILYPRQQHVGFVEVLREIERAIP